jgi:hypothetical protein
MIPLRDGLRLPILHQWVCHRGLPQSSDLLRRTEDRRKRELLSSTFSKLFCAGRVGTLQKLDGTQSDLKRRCSVGSNTVVRLN